MEIYVICEYSKVDGMRVRGVEIERGVAMERAHNLWHKCPAPYPVDFVVELWRPGQFELNSLGERQHVIYSLGSDYKKNEERQWEPQLQL